MEANLIDLVFFNSRDELLRIDISKITNFEIFWFKFLNTST